MNRVGNAYEQMSVEAHSYQSSVIGVVTASEKIYRNGALRAAGIRPNGCEIYRNGVCRCTSSQGLSRGIRQRTMSWCQDDYECVPSIQRHRPGITGQNRLRCSQDRPNSGHGGTNSWGVRSQPHDEYSQRCEAVTVVVRHCSANVKGREEARFSLHASPGLTAGRFSVEAALLSFPRRKRKCRSRIRQQNNLFRRIEFRKGWYVELS